MLLLSDDERDSVRQEADLIRTKIADLTRNAARLENLPSESGSEELPECSDDAETGWTAWDLRVKTLKLGRVDVFLATDFHGGPFEREENECYAHENDDGSYAASLSACDTSLCAQTGARGEQSSGLGGMEAVVCARGRRDGEGRDDGVGEEKEERLWVSKRVLTAG